MSASDDGVFRTDDMTLATLLRARGHKYEIERIGHRKVIWLFDEVSDVSVFAKQYHERSVKVEPRAFMRDYADVRKELYRFLGIEEPAHRRQLRDAPPSDAAATA